MNSTHQLPDLQDRIEQLASKIAADKVLGTFLPKEALQDFLTDGLSQLLNSSLQLQRKIHLDHSPEDRANGYAPTRTIHMGTTPLEVQIPRSRNGFYPPILPKYQRYVSDTYADLLRQILMQAKSFKSAVRTLQSSAWVTPRPKSTNCSTNSTAKPRTSISDRSPLIGTPSSSMPKSFTSKTNTTTCSKPFISWSSATAPMAKRKSSLLQPSGAKNNSRAGAKFCSTSKIAA